MREITEKEEAELKQMCVDLKICLDDVLTSVKGICSDISGLKTDVSGDIVEVP